MHVPSLSRLLVVPVALAVLSCEPTSSTDVLSSEDITAPLGATVPSPDKLIAWSGNNYNITMQDGSRARIVRDKPTPTRLKIYKYINGAYRLQVTIDQVRHNGRDRFYSARLVKPNGQWIRVTPDGRILETFDCKYGCDLNFEGGFGGEPGVCLVSTSETGSCNASKYALIAAAHSMFVNGLVSFGFWALGPVGSPIAARFGWAAVASSVGVVSFGLTYLQCRRDKGRDCGPGDGDPCDNFVGMPRIS